MATTLLIADDHTLLRQGLVLLLRQKPGLEVVAEAENGHQAVALALEHRPDVVILDYAMPEMDGPEACREILRQLPETHIVTLSMHGEPHFVQIMLDAGAGAYVLKSEAVSDLVKAIHAVRHGHQYISESLRQGVLFPAPRTARSVLSGREEQVLRLLAQGKSSRECAATMGIGIKTVETYQRRLREKLNLDSTAALVKYAISVGLATLDYQPDEPGARS